MLRDLHIKNLAVVADASICFGSGFNILTGETGAGKSIVVDALALLAGARASSELIRAGSETLVVTGVFEPAADDWRQTLEDIGLESGDDGLVIRREISAAGKNRVFVNDQPATLRLVQGLAPGLLRIHGQREELGLVAPDLQRAWLDRCGGNDAVARLEAVAEAFRAWSGLAERLTRRDDKERARHERIDLLRFQLQELESAQITAGEEHALRQERSVLRNAEAIGTALEVSVGLLYDQDGAAVEHLAEAGRHLESISRWESDGTAWVAEIEELRIRAGELADALRQRQGDLEANPRRLDAIEDRLALLERLMRKHGEDTEGLVARQLALAAELGELANDEDDEDKLRTAAAAALADYRRLAVALSSARSEWAQGLAKRTRNELSDLALAKSRFDVGIESRSDASSPLEIDGDLVAFGPTGIDRVVFTFSPNPGEAPKPLAKAASGGEQSRLYLAVQLAAKGGGAGGATMIFDEVDSGIGGAEAAALGDKLRRLARGGQILAVTHLPQVASQGDRHFKVSKAVRRGRTHTMVEALEDDALTEEVARMLAGSEITELSLSHARELITGTNAARSAS